MNSSVGVKKRKIFIIAAAIFAVVASILIFAAIYLGDYYRADEKAIMAYLSEDGTVTEERDGRIVFEAEGATKGFIFYPGGKVEYTAYIPLMKELSDEGITTVLIKMPFNLAVFGINSADGIKDEYPEIEEWYIGGHSLGGSMAASYLEKHTKDFAGLVLLGSYSTADLSDTSLKVLTVYGSEDKVMNREKYEENRKNLPEGFTERIVPGANHAYFGMYGEQDGDGSASISPEDQIFVTKQEICCLIFSKNN